jgi:predicted ester cyclase
MAEGHYGGFFGWPNLSLVPSGGYLGLPPSEQRSDMRVIDIYRRDGDKIAENWVFIDMLHFLKMQGIDVLSSLNS